MYDLKTSIYDIAKTKFRPLMLREHFRCVPEIIGFSNNLSYDGKIKPLRDAGKSILLPAVVNYRVADGQRDGRNKINHREAETVIALMQACIEQPEYKGKSFGVISLLGDEQAKLMQRLIEEKIEPKEIESRQILCGNSANFQGDERDVVFLSLVDSGNGMGPLNFMGFGPDEAYRKRYNVAASRARDQLWVVHSLDPANDLKAGDLRKQLIDYAIDPHRAEMVNQSIEKKAESPFEASVTKALTMRGYHLEQQKQVGAYRLDIVAICGKQSVAIECDGERWHSSETQIREDMERQTILERLGWRFIRIRGSEYYRDPDKTIEYVTKQLSSYGIEPEPAEAMASETRETELLNRVKQRAAILLGSSNDPKSALDVQTVAAALNGGEFDVPKAATTESQTELNLFSSLSESVKSAKEPEKQYAKVATVQKNDVQVAKKDVPAISAPEKKSEQPHQTSTAEQLSLGVEKGAVGDPVIALLKRNNVKYVDKRPSGGSLWMTGGEELKPVANEAKKLGVKFTFSKNGGTATKLKPGWYGK